MNLRNIYNIINTTVMTIYKIIKSKMIQILSFCIVQKKKNLDLSKNHTINEKNNDYYFNNNFYVKNVILQNYLFKKIINCI